VILRPASDACLAIPSGPPRKLTARSRLVALPWAWMSAEPIDFAAEGLLDGLDGSQRTERIALLE